MFNLDTIRKQFREAGAQIAALMPNQAIMMMARPRGMGVWGKGLVSEG
jgi:hypothetical protein